MRVAASLVMAFLGTSACAEGLSYTVGQSVATVVGGGFLRFGSEWVNGRMADRGHYLFRAQADGAASLGKRTIAGMIETCGADPDLNVAVCTILSGGTRYVIADDGTGDPDLLLALLMEPEWTSVLATVEVLDETGTSARATLLDLEVRAQDEYTRMVEVLAGSWRDVARPGSGLIFDDTRLAETLQDVPIRSGPFDILSECRDLPGPHLSVAFDDGEHLCWVILDQSPDRLRLRSARDGTEFTYEKR
ncbi:hypothetical protein SAMN05216376_1169 [Mameliella alba]|uniref:hypothetical protein n=1 Tax=Mameliella alba TaxID=561184 RepID=UPI00087F32FC|nr:hypothetical protein [Mameliella alba]OWV43058.1 hypothetical protein CDZ96_22275 [Mameliella alba]PTR36061.1 hypothetical protein LX94_04451 [Mameliella alba]GGF81138.1 hypothetical protein GCM10011319_46560 [Mameliella alba]SDE02830.1 hypothetical protein SAMN05216376_1169 [Mameliella alba]